LPKRSISLKVTVFALSRREHHSKPAHLGFAVGEKAGRIWLTHFQHRPSPRLPLPGVQSPANSTHFSRMFEERYAYRRGAYSAIDRICAPGIKPITAKVNKHLLTVK
jgi:hypothetical protein